MLEGTRATWGSASSGRVASAKASLPESLTSESSAHELISAVWNALDQNLQNTTKIIDAVIDFLGEEEKKYNLLAAWNQYTIESQVGLQNTHPAILKSLMINTV